MNALRWWSFLLVLNLFILAACIPVGTVAPSPTPRIPITSEPEPTQVTLTVPAPTATLSPSPAATLPPATQPPSTSTLAATPTILVASSTPESTRTPTSLPPTVVPPASRPPTSVPPTSEPPTLVPPTPCAFTWFVTNPPKECPDQAPLYSLTVAQHFERGVLLWREKPDFYGSQIYAFFNDNKWPYWNPTNDQWRLPMPESDPNIVPPAGFFQPVRGFGIFWRNAYFGATAGAARDRLGWATDQEFSLGQLPMQCRNSANRSYGCLVAGPDNLVYDIEPNNAWSVWAGTVIP